jgi:hypothetical protein
MAPQYILQIYDSSGVLQATVIDYISLSISRVVNGIDLTRFELSASSPAASYMINGNILEVYRSDIQNSIASYREFAGIIRSTTTTYEAITVIQITAVNFNILLADRVVAYKSGISNRSQFSSIVAETIITTLYNFNLGPSATVANGRIIDGRLTGATSATSSGSGNSLSLSCSGQNLLDVCQKIALDGGGDFAINYTAPATWALVWYTGQMGADRTASIYLSLLTGTIGKIIVYDDRIINPTAAIVAGQGEASARTIIARPASLPTNLNLREVWVDARSQKNTSEYNQLGDVALALADRERSRFDTTVLQNEAYKYGRDYFLGDLITLYNGSSNVTQKVQGVTITLSKEGAEGINVKLVTP